MFQSKKNTNKYHNYIIVSEKDTGVRNYHFSRKFALIVIGISVLSISSILFFTANALTGVLYKTKMNISKYLNIINIQTNLNNIQINITSNIEIENTTININPGIRCCVLRRGRPVSVSLSLSLLSLSLTLSRLPLLLLLALPLLNY